MNTDSEWEKWGKKDPYFGVETREKYRSQSLTEEAILEFFESGKTHIRHVIEVCRRHLDQGFSPKRILDFGCGTGRHIIPFAEIAEHVVGLDVSDSMLNEASKNCDKYSVQNVSLLKSDDNLSSLDECFDLIHSHIVFQHIPVKRGRRIFAHLLNHLREGGICTIHFTYSKAIFEKNYGMPPMKWRMDDSYTKVKQLVRGLLRIKSPSEDPEMQMNPYNLNELFFLIQSAGIHNIHLEFRDHRGELGVFLYFQKPKKA